jgi:hypothetical protein
MNIKLKGKLVKLFLDDYVSKVLLIMHHIVLCTPCITLFNCGHLLHIQVDHGETKTENQVEQVQWMFGDPQASSCVVTNIA